MSLKSTLPDLHIPDKSLCDLLFERRPQYGDDIALIDSSFEGKSVTFKEVYDQIRSCAGFLYKQGLKRGDVVGLCAPSCSEFPIAMLSVMATGGVVTPCNPRYTEDEILRQFADTKPQMVFVHEDAVDVIKEVSHKFSSLKNIFVIGKSDEFTTFKTMIASKHEKDFPQDVAISPSEDLACLPYSSGTTGLPKGVMHTHKSLMAMALLRGAVCLCDRSVCYYIDRPMFHGVGFVTTIMTLVTGTKLVTERVFQVEKMLSTIAKYNVTQLFANPSMMVDMINVKNLENYDTSSLKVVHCGGAVLSPSIMGDLTRRYKSKILPMYGQTEFSPIASNADAENYLKSVGSVPPNTEIKVIDSITGKAVGTNTEGEIAVKGPQMMKGYLNNPEATRQAIDGEGWIHTGDIGYFDEHGMLYIIDRLKEVIKYKTLQVSPAELENVILKHPKVADVGVIGIPDLLAGEIPKAFVVKKDQSLTQEEILDLVKRELSDHKQLRGVEFIKEVPKSSVGKIQRRKLKNMSNAQ